MSHHVEPTTVYFWLVTNTLFAASFAAALPWIILKEARKLRYMQNLKAQLTARLLALSLILLGVSFVFDIINEHFWTNTMLHTFIWLWASIFVSVFTLVCWVNRHALGSLYPQEEFILEQDKRHRLLTKLQACDERMPMPRIESRNGVVTHANRVAQQVFGYSVKDMHQLGPAMMVHPDDRARVFEHVLHRNVGMYEARMVTSNGRIITMEVSSVYDPADPELRISFFNDVTRYVELLDRRRRELLADRAQQQVRSSMSDLDFVLSQGSLAS